MSTDNKITFEHVQKTIVSEEFLVIPGTTTTVCILTLINGWNATGESACVDPENFDKTLGENAARERAIGKVFELEGYLMKQYMYQAKVWGRPLTNRVDDFISSLGEAGASYKDLYEQNCQPLNLGTAIRDEDVMQEHLDDVRRAESARGMDGDVRVADAPTHLYRMSMESPSDDDPGDCDA